MANQPFELFAPDLPAAPIVISCPHSGTSFPDDEIELYHPDFVDHPSDTDWYVDKLYGFARELNIPLLAAKYSRFVVDLNRPANDQPLYRDGRFTTGLFPTHSFQEQALYRRPLTDQIKQKRLQGIYQPYHDKIEELLSKCCDQWGAALLFDAHSIKSRVTSIRSERFPHFIIGTADGSSSPRLVSDTLANQLQKWPHATVSLNDPFKGGYITRNYGDLNSNIWSVQLEMSQDLYLNEANDQPNADFNKISDLLKQAIQALMEVMKHATKS